MHIILQLTSHDVLSLQELNVLFGDVFEMDEYSIQVPSEAYLENFLSNSNHIVLVAKTEEGTIIGGLVAYVLPKFEQQRSEMYIYDLAVSIKHHRQGVATALINRLREIARERGVYVIFVQADQEDDGAIGFYRSLPITEEIQPYHFDIEV